MAFHLIKCSMPTSLRHYWDRLQGEGVGATLARGSTGSFALKTASTGLAFIISVLLARFLGATGYGAYAFAIAWTHLLGIPAMLGMENLLVHYLAAYRAQSEWGLMRGLLRWVNRKVLMVSLGVALLAAIISWALSENLDRQMLVSFWIALISVPLLSQLLIRKATMQGLQRVVQGQLPEALIRPVLFIALVIGAYFYLDKDLSAPWIVGVNVIAMGVALMVGIWLLSKYIPPSVSDATPAYQTLDWLRSAMPLLLMSCMTTIISRVDVVILGTMAGAEAAGLYHVAKRGAELIPFVLISVNAALAPTIASLYAKGEMEQLQRVVTKTARIILLFSLPPALALILFGHWFLLLFGAKFTGGNVALAILSSGQLINAAMGSVGLLLILTGHGRDAVLGIGIGAASNVILNLMLIPRWGIEGAATAAAVSIILWNLLLATSVYRRIGINSTAMGSIAPYGRKIRWREK